MGPSAFGTPAAHKGTFLEVYRRQVDRSWEMVTDTFSRDQAAPSHRSCPISPQATKRQDMVARGALAEVESMASDGQADVHHRGD
jgi:hypothetical protein